MAELFYDKDADLSIIQGKKVAVIGYGSQGHAHAQNLRDSGVQVKVGLREGSRSETKAKNDGLDVASVADASAWADTIMILVPDHMQRIVYKEDILPNLAPGKTIMFGHGFNIHFGYIEAPDGVDVSMVAPKGPGHLVRREYVAGRGVPILVAVEKDVSGHALRERPQLRQGDRRPPRRGHQDHVRRGDRDRPVRRAVRAVRRRSQLVQYGFEVLTEAGYQPEIAYFEVLHELKLIVDLMVEGGITKQRWSVSDTAEYGDYVSGPRVIDPSVKTHMQEVLTDIQTGVFAKRFIDDQDKGGAKEFAELRAKGEAHPIEPVGRDLRKLFAWVEQTDSDYEEGKAHR